MSKIFDIALKDMSQSFRSLFALLFMFGVPIMIAVIFYFMFGNSSDEEGFSIPITNLVIANLDEGDPAYAAISTSIEGGSAATLGEMIEQTLSDPQFEGLLDVSTVPTAQEARQAVDDQQAGVALILPAEFSSRYMQEGETTTLELYADPTLTIGPAIVRSLIQQIMDAVSGGKIAVHLAQEASGGQDPAVIGAVMQQYIASQQAGASTARITSRSTSPAVATGFLGNIIAWIYCGMSVFYAFYTGFATGQSILREEERKTLPRLFTTPTPQSHILTGKLLAVFLTVVVQLIVLLLVGSLIFQINWGDLAPVALLVLMIVITSSAFGIFFNSLLKSSKQAGAIFGGVITITGMLGMLPIFMMGAPGATWAKLVSLFVPQGWAVQGLLGAMLHAPLGEVALMAGGLLVWSVVFLVVGIWRFNRRYI